MDVDSILCSVAADLKKGFVSPQSLTSRMPYVSPNTSRKPFFSDPIHLPCYYHLGKYLNPKRVLDLSLGSGLQLGCFLLGCKDVEKAAGFQYKSDEFYSLRLAKHNVRQCYRKALKVYAGQPSDKKFNELISWDNWDVVILSNNFMDYDDYLAYMRIVFPYIFNKGIMIVDYINYHNPADRAFGDFCDTNGIIARRLKSKYGMGILAK